MFSAVHPTTDMRIYLRERTVELDRLGLRAMPINRLLVARRSLFQLSFFELGIFALKADLPASVIRY